MATRTLEEIKRDGPRDEAEEQVFWRARVREHASRREAEMYQVALSAEDAQLFYWQGMTDQDKIDTARYLVAVGRATYWLKDGR